jgi:tetratricopeptide (TPR) repeat protein
MTDRDRIREAVDLSEAGELDDAWDIVESILRQEPDNARAIICATSILDKAKKLPMSYIFAQRAVQLAPHIAHTWINRARMSEQLYLLDEALADYRQAEKILKDDKTRAFMAVNLSALHITRGEFADAERAALMALRIEPDNIKAQVNYGMACLGQGKWREGWPHYGKMLSTNIRPEVRYGSEPVWDGSRNRVVAVYGEQGLGDEVAFASIVPDAAIICNKLILECDPRLGGLFKRSFPNATVYGTRGKNQKNWAEGDKQIDASIAIGQLGQFFRNADSEFPGTPYLKADPERVMMWRHLFATKKHPVIGIAWTGGLQHTAAQLRKLTLEQLSPVLTALPAHWVSLQYRDAKEEISAWNAKFPNAPIHQYTQATLTKDYDDTAALVDACDMVVTMQTAVVHLAGGLGKQTVVMVPKEAQWRYGMAGETIPWYRSVEIIRQSKSGNWSPVIERVKSRVLETFKKAKAA